MSVCRLTTYNTAKVSNCPSSVYSDVDKDGTWVGKFKRSRRANGGVCGYSGMTSCLVQAASYHEPFWKPRSLR
ncbi:MAG: hypothetical protein FRX49_11846 [Trebouxia sp. A1-2]|nr:MAG: hypothetical protein FRX49_11846 [Trebouxia sp. A1-2]